MLDIRPVDKTIILQILKHHLPTNSKVLVFGSRVTNKAKPFSDLDLAIDLNGETLSLELMANLAFDFEESDLPYKVDIVDWNVIDTTFQARIRVDCQALDLF